MVFKDARFELQLYNTSKILQKMAFDFDYLSTVLGVESVVTRVSDPVEGESGVHRDNRAVDFRDEHMGRFLYSEDQRDIILGFLNLKYARKDGKKSVIWHSFNGNPAHFHLQVPSDPKQFMHYNKLMG